jgi:hypothetical protein
MRVEFKVCEVAGVWCVQRGHTGALTYLDYEAAVRAAETMARSAAAKGEKGAVRIMREGQAPEMRTFPPEVPASRPRIGYNPEQDWRNTGRTGFS